MYVVVYVSCMYACMMYVVRVFLTFAGLFAGLEWHVISSIPLILTPTHSTLRPFNLELMEQRLCSRPTVGCQHIER